MDQKRPVVLLVYGDIDRFPRTLSATEIFNTLTSQNMWFVMRMIRYLVPGATLVFYEKRVGVTGYAELVSFQKCSHDSEAMRLLGVSYFSHHE